MNFTCGYIDNVLFTILAFDYYETVRISIRVPRTPTHRAAQHVLGCRISFPLDGELSGYAINDSIWHPVYSKDFTGNIK